MGWRVVAGDVRGLLEADSHGAPDGLRASLLESIAQAAEAKAKLLDKRGSTSKATETVREAIADVCQEATILGGRLSHTRKENRRMADMPEQVWDLLRLLIRQTNAGQVAWQASGETSFILSRDKGSVTLFSDDNDGQHPFTLALVNPDGVMVDSWSTRQDEEWADYASEVAELYAEARRSAQGATSVIRDLLDDLRQNEPDIPDDGDEPDAR